MLVAGPWAVEDRIVNPSYVSPCTYAELGAHTDDGRWEMASRQWAGHGPGVGRGGPASARLGEVADGGRLEPIGSPGRPARAPHYGLDAARLPFRLAEGCDEEATGWRPSSGTVFGFSKPGERRWPTASTDGTSSRPSTRWAWWLRGRPRSPPVAPDDARSLLDGAADLQSRHPTYYGAAWLALGQVLMEGAKGE